MYYVSDVAIFYDTFEKCVVTFAVQNESVANLIAIHRCCETMFAI